MRDALGAFDPKYDGLIFHLNPVGQKLNALKGRVIEHRRLVRGTKTKHSVPWNVKTVPPAQESTTEGEEGVTG